MKQYFVKYKAYEDEIKSIAVNCHVWENDAVSTLYFIKTTISEIINISIDNIEIESIQLLN